jgi:signal transduction histidine kinase
LQAQRALLASAAHELKNPMQALDNILFLMEQQTRSDPELHAYVNMAQQEVHRMKQVSVHSLAVGREPGHPSFFTLSGMLDTVLDFHDPMEEHQQVTIECHYDTEGQICALSGPLRRVFTNLIVNALEALHAEER